MCLSERASEIIESMFTTEVSNLIGHDLREYIAEHGPSDMDTLEKDILETHEDFLTFKKFGRRQKQWWRSPLLQMAGGDVHIMWLHEMPHIVYPGAGAVIHDRQCKCSEPVAVSEIAVEAMMLTARWDAGACSRVSWKEFFKLNEVDNG